MNKTLYFLILGVFLMGMSSQKKVVGELALCGNEPFSYLVLRCDDGSKLRLDEKKPEWLDLQGKRVELVYMQTEERKILPIVKVVELKAE